MWVKRIIESIRNRVAASSPFRERGESGVSFADGDATGGADGPSPRMLVLVRQSWSQQPPATSHPSVAKLHSCVRDVPRRRDSFAPSAPVLQPSKKKEKPNK